MTITGRDIEHLLYTDTPDPVLVVHNGQTQLVAADELEDHTGAVVVCSRAELLRHVGERDLSEQELTAIAATLTAAIQDPAQPRPLWPA
ncbi:hypothetical protein SAMN05216188_107159 [Lentzea xinjiangensis]|uniref:Uncharacterized protein n=1 Tax=Lentzea xinjiangensis TaxID=402600 RepID=A0A1H9KX69_9PSEU|nr:hypothetical protein [Lentzea xinjiangensis]SER03746.1 hypothetical protein SAMN05216188_107159 [Lentzea xinjiangensis]